MENKINILNESVSEMELTFAADEISEDIKSEISKQSKKIQIDGFRKGKAPQSVIKKLFGDSLEYEAAEKVANKKFWDSLDSKNIKPLGEPVMTSFDYKPGGELKFKIKYEVYPNIELKLYKNIDITLPKYSITEKDVEEQLKSLRQSRAAFEDAEVVEGNEFNITIDLQEKDVNGEPLLGKEYKGMTVDLSRAATNPQIVENSQAKKVGDKFEFVFVDAHSHKKDDGTEEEHREEKRFDATITKIQKQVLPAIDEAFVHSITRGEHSEEAGLKTYIREMLENEVERTAEKMLNNIFDSKLIEYNNFEAPKTLVDYFYDKILKEEREQRGKNFKPTKEFEDQMRWDTETMFKLQVIREKIVETEKLELTDEIVENYLEEDSKMLKIPIEKLRAVAGNEEKKREFSNRLYRNFLRENNNIKYVSDEKLAEGK